MLYTKSLLNTYLDTTIDPHKLWDMLTLKVCEVEEVTQRHIPDDMVIWLITETRSHPDADKLTVCQVDCGARGSYQICCGATNVRAGIFVVVALPGCHLPAIGLTIEPRELRWEDSNGMICSKEELGIAEDLEEKWIWALQLHQTPTPEGTPSPYQGTTDSIACGSIETVRDFDDITDKDRGTWLGDKYPRLNTRSLDVENKTITHRPDMFGHFGLAVELQAMLDSDKWQIANSKEFESIFAYGQSPDTVLADLSWLDSHSISIQIESDKVLTYNTILLQDISRADADLRTRLQMIELWLQPRSNWVDYSNVFMYRTGQPIHFFDADKIEWGLIIRQAKEGERFVDLFDKEHELTPDDIVIADHTKICALAGIVWSNTSGIDESTKTILVEVANFDPVQVRKTGTRLGLRTDAELRFEKTINPMWSIIATKVFVDTIEQQQTCTPAWVSIYTSKDVDTVLKTIDINRERVSSMIWSDIQREGQQILESLWCELSPHPDPLPTGGTMSTASLGEGVVTIPAWRSGDDLETEACIVEEIARIQWFETIPSLVHTDASGYVPYTPQVQMRRSLEELMIQQMRFVQTETYPWIRSRWIDMLGIDTSSLYEMTNGLNPEWKYLRPTMIWSLLEVIEKNAPFFDVIKICDIGNVWAKELESMEQERICFGIYQKSPSTLDDNSLLESKSIIQNILTTIWAKGKLQYIATEEKVFHPRQQAEIKLNGKIIWHLQTLHPYYAQQLKLPDWSQVVIVQLDLTTLLDISLSQKKWTRGMSSYETLQDQIVTRDLNFVLDTDQWYGSISDAILKIKEVKDVEVFDIYGGEHLPAGKKSIALRLKIVWDTELQTEEINAVMDKAIENVKGVGGELR